MAAVTYDGVASAEGGNIFKGMNFWVAQRIPSRTHFIEQIESNGGKVVPLEKQADILIADHARSKFAPQGSYSWKYIEDSVKNGIAQLKDRYLIGLDPTLPRPAGGGAGAKTTRTPFTKADDQALAKWVLTHGTDRAGNKMYQEFAAQNPRHTWQSWRDRFVKKLQNLPRETLQKMADLAPEQPVVIEGDRVGEDPQATPQEPAKQSTPQPRKRREARQTKRVTPPEPSPSPVPEPIPQVTKEIQSNGQQPIENSDERGSDYVTMMNVFYQDLNEYIVATETDIKLQPKILGRTIELYDLSVAVQRIWQESGPGALDEHDWAQVAESLGFSPQDADALSQLRQCFDESLAEFLDAIEDYNPDGEVEAEAEVELGGQAHSSPHQQDGFLEGQELGQPQESDWVEESPSHQALVRHQQNYIRSSPPIRTKRPLDQLPLTSSGPLTKRSRFDKQAVIPSTPDLEVGEGRRVPSTQFLSPTIRKSLMRQDYVDASEASQQLPPLPPVDDDELEEDVEEEEDPEPEVQELPQKTTVQLSPLLDTGGAAIENTPSQQLRFESLNPSPIPFSLERPSQTKKRVFGRSISNPVQASGAGPSNQHQEPTTRRTITPSANLSTAAAKSTQAPRRSLPSTFKSENATHESASHQKPAVPSPTVALPKQQKEKAHSVPQPTPSASNRRDIDHWIKYYERLGFSRPVIIEGLKCTTLTPGAQASIAMQNIQLGKGVPPNYEGIWTDRDDTDLLFIGSIDFSREPVGPVEERQYRRAQKAAKRLNMKHKERRVQLRKAFLEAQSMAEQDGEASE